MIIYHRHRHQDEKIRDTTKSAATWSSRSLVIDELNVSNTAKSVEADANGHQEVVFGRWTEGTSVLLVDDNVLRCSHIILAIEEGLANAADFFWLHEDVLSRLILNFLRDESESLIKREHFLPLVHNLADTIFHFVLVQLQLNSQLRVVLVVASAEFRHVTELS